MNLPLPHLRSTTLRGNAQRGGAQHGVGWGRIVPLVIAMACAPFGATASSTVSDHEPTAPSALSAPHASVMAGGAEAHDPLFEGTTQRALAGHGLELEQPAWGEATRFANGTATVALTHANETLAVVKPVGDEGVLMDLGAFADLPLSRSLQDVLERARLNPRETIGTANGTLVGAWLAHPGEQVRVSTQLVVQREEHADLQAVVLDGRASPEAPSSLNILVTAHGAGYALATNAPEQCTASIGYCTALPHRVAGQAEAVRLRTGEVALAVTIPLRQEGHRLLRETHAPIRVTVLRAVGIDEVTKGDGVALQSALAWQTHKPAVVAAPVAVSPLRAPRTAYAAPVAPRT
jgi:hypothetical protein